ncbi:hypothetical protein ACWGHM_40760 [Streptomyces sp. NPDC054904]
MAGAPGEDALQRIHAEVPELAVQLVAEGSIMVGDFNPKRVFIYVKDGRVSREPRRG